MTPGTYTKVTVDGQGAVTQGEQLGATDLPNVPTEKLETKKLILVDGSTIAITETATTVALRVKEGGVGTAQLANEAVAYGNLLPGVLFNNDPNYAANYANPHSTATLDAYITNYCDGEKVDVVFLNNGPNAFELTNGAPSPGAPRRYCAGEHVFVVNRSASLPLGVRTEGGSVDIKTVPVGTGSLFVCAYPGNSTLTDDSVWIPVS